MKNGIGYVIPFFTIVFVSLLYLLLACSTIHTKIQVNDMIFMIIRNPMQPQMHIPCVMDTFHRTFPEAPFTDPVLCGAAPISSPPGPVQIMSLIQAKGESHKAPVPT